MKYLFFVFLFLTACDFTDQIHVSVEPRLMPFYKSFIKNGLIRGIDLSESNVYVGFGDLRQKVYLGLTEYDGIVRITIDSGFYNSYKNNERGLKRIEYIVYHELGHALLNRQHTLDYSIMNGSVNMSEYSHNQYLRKKLIDELFKK